MGAWFLVKINSTGSQPLAAFLLAPIRGYNTKPAKRVGPLIEGSAGEPVIIFWP